MLLRKSLAPGCLAGLQFAVFGLGDSNYPKYNVRCGAKQPIPTPVKPMLSVLNSVARVLCCAV
jgi:sulfite reductase alpha subunit-like flavoprotein